MAIKSLNYPTVIAVKYMKYFQKSGECRVSPLHYPGRVGEIPGYHLAIAIFFDEHVFFAYILVIQ